MSSPVPEMDQIMEDLWKDLVEKSLEKSSKSVNDVLPLQILLNLAEKILAELYLILDSCISSG